MDIHEEERLAFAEELEEVALQLSMLDPVLGEAEQIEQVSSEYERLAMAADMFGLAQVRELIGWVDGSLLSPAMPELLAGGKYFSWLEVTALVFREPEEVGHLPLLMGELSDPLWPEPLPAEQLQSFLLSLRPVEEEAENEESEQTQDSPLSFAHDIHPELLDAYMEETPGHVTETARLMRLIASGSNTKEQRQQAARLAHTLKGSSSVVGVEAITSFTHRLEDLLDFSLQPMPDGLGDTLEASADCLETLFDNLQSQSGLPNEYSELNQSLTEWISRLEETDEGDEATTADGLLSSLAALTALPDFLQQDGVADGNPESDDHVQDVATMPASASRLSEERVQQMLNLAGELITSTSQVAELLQGARQVSSQLYQQDEQIRQRLDELEGLVEQQKQQGQWAQGDSSDETVVQAEMDVLEIESYSDLYSTTSLLSEAAADSRELALELQGSIRRLTDELYQQQRVQRQISDAVLSLRLAPVSNLVPRMERIVRETCRKTGKQADFEVEGDNLQVDTDILKGLADPMLHLLRNAVDHGIESPELRQSAAKPETGKIKLSFSQSGNHVVLVLEDDGGGINPQEIRERAVQRQLIDENDSRTDEELLRLVLLPGFSTRDEVSEVSGRGVGMDVVKSAIDGLRGTLRLESETGEGTRIVVTLPQTLIATHAVIVRAGGNLLAIPADNVEQLLYVTTDENIVDEQGWRIETGRYQLPVMKLADVLHWVSPDVQEQQPHTLLIARGETRAYAFYVEEILPSRDIVINSLAPWLNFIHSVQGACILADGGVAPVLDMMRMLHELEDGVLTPRAQGSHDVVPELKTVSSILVVDDSLSNRKSMRLMLEGFGYAVHTAVDGMDALKLMNTTSVDLVLTDLEMPRMNGLEMTQAIRIWPEMEHLPIVMVTSRSTRKHRELAQEAGADGYLTKPVQSVLLQQEVQKWLGTQLNKEGE